MIAHLRGTVSKLRPGEIAVDVGGVGYRVLLPMTDWDALPDGSTAKIAVATYVREDRLELYGFLDAGTRVLFEELIALSGIGPKMGLELCGVPRSFIGKAIREKDPRLLASVKGIGKKTAEKLLVELGSLAERHPEILTGTHEEPLQAKYDRDAVAALTQLGFSAHDVLAALEMLPPGLATTEERVAAALRSL